MVSHQFLCCSTFPYGFYGKSKRRFRWELIIWKVVSRDFLGRKMPIIELAHPESFECVRWFHVRAIWRWILSDCLLSGEMIIPNDRYSMHEAENSMYAVQMVLTIKTLQKSDFGGYKCISKNSIGGIEATIRLYGKLCLIPSVCLRRKSWSNHRMTQ